MNLERYSFLWSEVRLVIAAVALLLGGIPVIRYIMPISPLYGVIGSLLLFAWIISGVASAYLLYRWFSAGNILFGQRNSLDMAAFSVSVVSGINLGIAGLSGKNIGMSIFSSYVFFVIAALVYLVIAFYLFRRWKAAGERVF